MLCGTRALEHVQFPGVPGKMRHALDRGRPGADDAHALIGEPVHRRAPLILRVAPGVTVVPPAGVERMAAERADSGDPRQLRHTQRAGAQHHERGRQPVAPAGLDDPARACLVPGQPLNFGVEQGVVIQAELPADALAVREDLRAVHIFFRRHVPGLFQQRQVDHRRRVALRAGIPVPVPGAAEVTALLDDADVDAGFPQPRRGDQAGEPAADTHDGPVIGPRSPFGPWCVGIVEVVREFTGEAEVLVVAVRAEPLVPLLGVPAAQRVGVDAAGPGRTLGRHRRLRRMSPMMPNEARATG